MSLTAMLALAAATADVPAPPAATTLQQDFDAATAAGESGDCAKAVPLFEALEKRPAVKPGSLSASAIAVRKGRCLIDLGRVDEGERAVLAGLPGLERAGASFDFDVTSAYRVLGGISYSRLDYDEAKDRFRRASASQTPLVRIAALSGLIKASSFDGGPEPLAAADEALRLAAALKPPSKDLHSAFYTLRARILLNRGETEAAYADLKQALSLSGGLTSRTTLSEASMRSDLALAALLLGRKDDARRYMAYTGAGRVEQSPFALGVSMVPPDCGEETGLRPEDFAIVEFGIAEDGTVPVAHTIYSRGGPTVAAAFARAVRDWYWQPERLSKIPPFYRAATRVELRCTTAGGPTPGVTRPLEERFHQWAAPHLGSLEADDRPAFLAALKRKLADPQAQSPAAQIAAIGALAIAEPRYSAETVAMLDRAVALTGQAAVPPEIVNSLRIFRLLSLPNGRVPGMKARLGRFSRQGVLALLQDTAIANDPIAADTLRLLADARDSTLTREVAEDRRLPDHHPLRQLALLTLANQAAAADDLAGAQALFARTGLTEQQCALIGPRPALRRAGGSYPQEAMEYGFEGWVRLEFDINADGTTANARPLIAYPPFVFVEAARKMARNVRYEASFRPGGGAACSANGDTVRFIIP